MPSWDSLTNAQKRAHNDRRHAANVALAQAQIELRRWTDARSEAMHGRVFLGGAPFPYAREIEAADEKYRRALTELQTTLNMYAP